MRPARACGAGCAGPPPARGGRGGRWKRPFNFPILPCCSLTSSSYCLLAGSPIASKPGSCSPRRCSDGRRACLSAWAAASGGCLSSLSACTPALQPGVCLQRPWHYAPLRTSRPDHGHLSPAGRWRGSHCPPGSLAHSSGCVAMALKPAWFTAGLVALTALLSRAGYACGRRR